MEFRHEPGRDDGISADALGLHAGTDRADPAGMKTHLLGLSVALVAAVACSSGESSQSQSATLTQVTTSDVDAAVLAANCGVSPVVTLDGKITLSGLGLRLTFRNNEKGTHENVQEVTSDVVVVPNGQTIAIPSFSADGTTKDPYVWVQLVDGNGNAVTGELLLGRCADGLANVATTAPVVATAHVDVESCDNTGSSVSVTGKVTLSGLTMRVIFRDSLDAKSSTVVTTQASLVVVPLDQAFTIPKQPSRGGVGGNPWIYAQFIDGSGNALGSQVLLGRCVPSGQ